MTACICISHAQKTSSDCLSCDLTNELFLQVTQQRQSSRDSNWLRAGRPRGRRSSPSRVKNSLISTSLRPSLGPTQLPVRWVPGTPSLGVKRPGREADHSQLVPRSRKCESIHPLPIRIHGVVLS
jgi:hypothetical protein